ncbi:hypothetical protein FB451DRAFT_1036508, partial [Mycena latifolia]
ESERIRLIYQLRDLFSDLHNKRIIHGDVKPQNILMCSDGRPRFCDFDGASTEGDGFVSLDLTYPYGSMFRGRNDTVPMTRAEDMYAMGLMVKLLQSLHSLLLSYDDETFEDVVGDLMDRCLVGFLSDMQHIDNPDVASLIETYIAAGPDRPDVREPAPV